MLEMGHSNQSSSLWSTLAVVMSRKLKKNDMMSALSWNTRLLILLTFIAMINWSNHHWRSATDDGNNSINKIWIIPQEDHHQATTTVNTLTSQWCSNPLPSLIDTLLVILTSPKPFTNCNLIWRNANKISILKVNSTTFCKLISWHTYAMKPLLCSYYLFLFFFHL